MKRILIIDDEKNVRLMYRSALETQPFEIEEADSAKTALDHFLGRPFDLAIVDLRMPGMDGLELIEQMNQLGIKTPAVMITAHGDIPNAVRAMQLGAIDFLQKPLLPDQLRHIVNDIIERHQPVEKEKEPRDFDYYLRCAKRAINLRDFAAGKRYLLEALNRNERSPEALNLAGVLFEMQEDYDKARQNYKRALREAKNYEPAQQNMRRIFELFQFGSSSEPYNLG